MANNELGKGALNARGGSNVDAKMPAEPLAFLRPETGEVIIVPAEDANQLRSHYNGLSDMVAELHSANKAVQLSEEHLQELEAGKVSDTDKALAHSVLGFALDWQQEAHEKLHAVYEKLDPLPESKEEANAGKSSGSAAPAKPKKDKHTTAGAGKRLVELISLSNDSPEERKKKAANDKEAEVDIRGFKQKIKSFKTAAELKKFGKWPKKMPERLVYVDSSKLKQKWPKFKDAEKTKWSEVYKKGGDGKRSLDKEKLRAYAKEQVRKETTISLKSIFGEDLSGGASITLGQWADNWNKAHKLERHGSLSHDGTQIADIELSAAAQLMRFTYGGSLNGDLSVMDRRLSVRVEGHAAVDFAKAEANLDLFFPRKDGWLWTVQDDKGESFNLIAGRCRMTVEVSGVVGASIAGELAMKVEVSALDNGVPKVSGKPGRKGKKARRKQTVSINTNDEAEVGTLDASVSAFAGARADASLTGVLEWRDPDHPEKEFASIASIAPTVGGLAGIGLEAKFKIEYTNGIFRFTAHASLCLGVGAEGALGFEVSAKQMGLFFRCLFYKIAYWQFKNLKIINDDAFSALKGIQFLAVQSGRAIESFYGETLASINVILNKVDEDLKKADARLKLANRILANRKALEYVTPEAKGMLIYQLTRHSYADVAISGAAVGDNYLGRQREAVLAVILSATSKGEAANIIQHISVSGKKGNTETNRAELRDFFRTEGVRDIDIPFYESPYPARFEEILKKLAMQGDFDGWYQAFYDHLMDEVPHGYALVDATSPAYEVLRAEADHRFFASSGWNAYYTSEA
ncbi:hypothetical protein [Cupriavidus sp. YAF13]|uniref:hypothetical protein n=1 Tax=Cupriavidus sp. YAF13 TaxID=3233075 RepID=UPI003F8F944C